MNSAGQAGIAPQVAEAAADWFARLQEEDAPEHDFQEWQRWLAAAPEHQRAYRDVERAWRLIGDAAPQALTAEGAAAPRRRVWALAASLLLAVATACAWYFMSHESAYSTATAEQRSFRLPDGTRITLGARSKVTPMFDGQARRIVLNFGEAFFEVSADPKRPFVVSAGSSEIRAVGTAFNVRSMQGRVLVSVTEGRVAVGRQDGVTLLSAGEQAAVTLAGRIEQKAPAASPVTWMQGRFEYRGEELRHVIEDLNRYTDRRIELADESLGALRYSGTVFPDHLDEWLQGISGALPVQVRDLGERREIVAPR